MVVLDLGGLGRVSCSMHSNRVSTLTNKQVRLVAEWDVSGKACVWCLSYNTTSFLCFCLSVGFLLKCAPRSHLRLSPLAGIQKQAAAF